CGGDAAAGRRDSGHAGSCAPPLTRDTANQSYEPRPWIGGKLGLSSSAAASSVPCKLGVGEDGAWGELVSRDERAGLVSETLSLTHYPSSLEHARTGRATRRR